MRMVKKIGIGTILVLVILLFTSYIYQQIGVYRDMRHFKPMGKLYDIEGHKMHIYSGGEGIETVVFASGWGTACPSIDFYSLCKGIEKHAKFAVYDRFGYGYSDITKTSRDIDNTVEEVRQLLQKSGHKPPFIFVGHSIASLEVTRYAQKYPEEVKGIVYLDAGNPDLYTARPDVKTDRLQRMYLFRALGINRLARDFHRVFGKSPEADGVYKISEEMKTQIGIYRLAKFPNGNLVDELKRGPANGKKVAEGGKLGDLPITVITADKFGKQREEWMVSQRELAKWSTMGKHVIADESEHYIHYYRDDLITEEIIELLNRAGN